MLEMALNFYGLESRWLNEEEKAESLGYILNALDEWENREREEKGGSIAEAVISKWLSKMKRVRREAAWSPKQLFESKRESISRRISVFNF
jgi:hypothetical protein